MTIKFLSATMTASLLLVAGAAITPSRAADEKPPKITSAVAKGLSATQAANIKKDYPAALAGIEDAKKVADRTLYDNIMIGRFAMAVHIGMQDLAAADADIEAAADIDMTGLPESEKIAVYKPALQLALNSKHYDKAAKYAKLYLATTPPPDAADQALAAQALYLGGDYAGATALAQKNVDAAKAAGIRPSRNDLDIIMSSQVKQKDEAGAEASLETLVQYYGDADDWGQILGVTLGTKGMRDVDYTYVGRLMLATGAKISSADASLMGGVSNKQAFYGDAEAFQKLGGPAPDAREVADKKSIPSQITAGAKQGGQYNVKLAEVLYGYGMYAEAETAARLAKTKGDAQDKTEPDMVIGMAQVAQGKFADAQTTFSGITAPTPANARVLRLWVYFAKQKLAPPAAAPAATAAAAPAK